MGHPDLLGHSRLCDLADFGQHLCIANQSSFGLIPLHLSQAFFLHGRIRWWRMPDWGWLLHAEIVGMGILLLSFPLRLADGLPRS
jgi:hypothetical protein